MSNVNPTASVALGPTLIQTFPSGSAWRSGTWALPFQPWVCVCVWVVDGGLKHFFRCRNMKCVFNKRNADQSIHVVIHKSKVTLPNMLTLRKPPYFFIAALIALRSTFILCHTSATHYRNATFFGHESWRKLAQKCSNF